MHQIDVSSKGLTRMSFADIQSGRNLIDQGESLGRFRICFERDGRSVRLCDSSVTPVVDGTGTCLLMMPGERGFEYQAKDNWYYLYSVTSVSSTLIPRNGMTASTASMI